MAEAPAGATARRTFYVLGSTGLVVTALYWGQRVLIPLALAVLLTFVLAPFVSRLERRGLRRVPAVLLVVGLAFLLLGAATWSIASQVESLIGDLPRYKQDVREKIAQLQGAWGTRASGSRGLLATVQDFLDEVERAGQPAASGGPVVRVQPERPSLFAQLQAVVSQFLGVLSTVIIVLLLVLALLIHREDLRNRIIRLAGRGRLTLTTRALDEAGRRIGGYLLGHSVVNAGFGAAVALGLLVVGVPYPALWGMLAAALRFVPVVGVWLVAPFPAVLAFISSPGAAQALEVLALFLVLELLITYLVEPWVCGPSIGVAPVPLLVAIMLWTLLWGVVGLVLATPLTVCLAVLGKHVRQLEFLAVLLGSRPALSPEARYYQRLLARDRYEAESVVREYLEDHTVEKLFDDVLVPALALVRRGRRTGELRPADEQFVLQTTRELVLGLGREREREPAEVPPGGGGPVLVLGLPAWDGVDEVVLVMLRHLAWAAGHDVLPARGGASSAGMVSLVQQEHPAAVFVASLAPGGLTQARYLCRRLHAQFPALRIVVGRWGHRRDPGKARKLLLSAGADRVVTTLREASGQLAHLCRTRVHAQDAAGG